MLQKKRKKKVVNETKIYSDFLLQQSKKQAYYNWFDSIWL